MNLLSGHSSFMATAGKHASLKDLLFIISATLLFFATSSPAYAFQEHRAPEGLYIHQLGHILFALSMAGLWYSIRQSRMWHSRPWRFFAAGALLFVLWNTIAFIGHLFSLQVIPAMRGNGGDIPTWAVMIWHFARLDNIICLSAMLCFYTGLRGMERQRAQKYDSKVHAA